MNNREAQHILMTLLTVTEVNAGVTSPVAGAFLSRTPLGKQYALRLTRLCVLRTAWEETYLQEQVRLG